MIAEWTIIFATILVVTLASIAINFVNTHNNRPDIILLRPIIFAIAPLLFVLNTYSGLYFGAFIKNGWNLVGIIIGSTLLLTVGLPWLENIAKIIRVKNINSLSEFLSARYGKTYHFSIIITLLILFISIPILGIQVWYLNFNTIAIIDFLGANYAAEPLKILDPDGAYLTIFLLFFAGYLAIKTSKRINGCDGVVYTISVVTLVSLTIFMLGAIYVSFMSHNGVWTIVDMFDENNISYKLANGDFSISKTILLSFTISFAIIFMPWQFHLFFVKNTNSNALNNIRNIFAPLLILVFIIFAFIAIASIIHINSSMGDNVKLDNIFNLSLFQILISHNSIAHALLMLFVSNISIILLMVIEMLVIGTIISNDIVLPILIRSFERHSLIRTQSDKLVQFAKSLVICVSLILIYLSYIYLPYSGFNETLFFGTLILLFQLAPATFAAIYWRDATAKSVISGILIGSFFWVITCGIPLAVDFGLMSKQILQMGIGGIGWLSPTHLFGLDFDQHTHSAIWSIGSNIITLILMSKIFKPSNAEKKVTQSFFDIQKNYALCDIDTARKNIHLYDLQMLVGQYIGQEKAEKRFKKFANNEGLQYELESFVDRKFLKFANYQLASAIGASSADFVMALVLERKNVDAKSTIKLLDEATELIGQNRGVLQSAIDNINHGICVLDEKLDISCWNKAFQELLNIPDAVLENKRSFQAVLQHCAQNGEFGEGDVDTLVASRILNYVVLKKTIIENIMTTEKVLKVNASSMPEGGCVITFDNITQQVKASKQLENANLNLEQRVETRTEELTQLNAQLEKAIANAEEADIDKTRFLAAASHDISQPMNAARLYSTALLEKQLDGDIKKIAQNLDLSLTSVEEILLALLDISRLDSGIFKAEKTHFELNELFEQLVIEFRPLAEKKNLKFKVIPTSTIIESDRRHLRRILQNFISNAIKYTNKGGVLVGCRQRGDKIRIDVFDTGHGVAAFQIKTIFKEFKRLENGVRAAQGVGLGLSIVDRISKMIGTELDIKSEVDRGSKFSCFVDLGDVSKAKIGNKNKKIAGVRQLPNLNVVCIDNEVEILNALETLFLSWGINGIYSETSKDALQLIKAKNIIPDAIIADYHLNFENGVFAIEKIRWQIDKPIVAVLATADRSEQVAKVCTSKDILLMHKPIKPAILRSILARIEVSSKD